MSTEQILQRVASLATWRRGSERAPHKPLLLLYAMARLADGQERMPFSEIEPALGYLLDEFGPSRKRHHPEYPFWRLQQDGLWIVDDAADLQRRQSNTDPLISELRRRNPAGRLAPDVIAAFRKEPALIDAVARLLLDEHFPDSYHDDILAVVGLAIELQPATITEAVSWHAIRRRRRDPAFRPLILETYGRQCAVCGFDVRVGANSVALEAAHIKWHQAGGPDDATNGLALCSIHHKLFDRGAFGLTDDHEVTVAAQATGGERFGEVLLAYEGRQLRRPAEETLAPARSFVRWHQREVFRSPARS